MFVRDAYTPLVQLLNPKHITVAPSLVSTHYLFGLTFSLDLMKWPQYGGCESLSLNNLQLLCFS